MLGIWEIIILLVVLLLTAAPIAAGLVLLGVYIFRGKKDVPPVVRPAPPR